MNTRLRLSPSRQVILATILAGLMMFTGGPGFLAPHSPLSITKAHAQSLNKQLVRLKKEIDQLVRKRTYSLALPKVKRYVMLTARKYGQRHERFASALELQAKIYRYLKRPRDAKKYQIRAASIRKKNRTEKAKVQSDIKKRRAALKKRRAERRALILRKKKKTALAQTKSQPQPQRSTRAMRTMPSPKRQMPVARPKPAPRAAMRRPQPKIATRRAARKPVAVPAPPAPVIVPEIAESKSPSMRSAGRAPAESVPMRSDEPVKKPENHTIVKVYYATDRQRTASKQLASFYGGEPADPIRISYGICEVSIPKGHKPGELEAPSIYNFEFKEDPDKHVVLLKVHPQEKKSYFRNLKKVIAQSKGENAFIFIHGYNVTFSDAARRTAQISYDLGFNGAPVFYSWPSTGELSGYALDEDNILWAQENLKHFLKDFVEKTDAKNIYLIAHSMGSRALTGAVGALISEAPKFKKRFREIILAAPDISARIFRDHIAPKMLAASKNVTLYVSADDKALLASRSFHSNPRAGEAGEKIIIFKGIDTIDATGLDASLLAHSYFAEAKSIITDIVAVFRGKRASTRKSLKQVKTKRGSYWSFSLK